MVIDATESRLFEAIELRVFDARCASICALRARGRKFLLLMIDEKNGEKFGGMGNND